MLRVTLTPMNTDLPTYGPFDCHTEISFNGTVWFGRVPEGYRYIPLKGRYQMLCEEVKHAEMQKAP